MGYSNKSLWKQVDFFLDFFIIVSEQQFSILINIHVLVILALAFYSAVG
jgi:hypothetical protein